MTYRFIKKSSFILSITVFSLLVSLPVHAGKFSKLIFNTAKTFRLANGEWSQERLSLHSKIVWKLLDSGSYTQNPSLVFSAGSPGSGKSTVLRELGESGHLDQSQYALLDPDHIKTLLPEYEYFKEQDPTLASQMVHDESVAIHDLALKEALDARKNVIVDGTMKATDHFKKFLTDVRTRRPDYHQTIIHVDTDHDTALKRIKARAELTGRHVPEHIFNASNPGIISKSVSQLLPLVDLGMHIHSPDGGSSLLTSCYAGGVTIPIGLPVSTPRRSISTRSDSQTDLALSQFLKCSEILSKSKPTGEESSVSAPEGVVVASNAKVSPTTRIVTGKMGDSLGTSVEQLPETSETAR